MSTQSLITKAANALQRYRSSLIRRRDRKLVSGLPDYLLKDIGWPSTKIDCCTDRAR